MIQRIHSGVQVLQDVEGGDYQEDQVEGVVVKYGEGRRLVVSHFVLLPQNPENTKNEDNEGGDKELNVSCRV